MSDSTGLFGGIEALSSNGASVGAGAGRLGRKSHPAPNSSNKPTAIPFWTAVTPWGPGPPVLSDSLVSESDTATNLS